jgi:hypothetical protein
MTGITGLEIKLYSSISDEGKLELHLSNDFSLGEGITSVNG